VTETRGPIPERVRRALYTLSRGRCYAPDCDQPVIVVEAGQPIFVGEIAHIVGATESGPRGRESIADREAFDNLLVLCGRHHKVIDNAHNIDRYPVEVLREWKAAHEAEFDTTTRSELRKLHDVPALLLDSFRTVTETLEETVARLEKTDQVTHETAKLLFAVLADTAHTGPGVGDGVPSIKEAFEEAYDAAGGASFLGLPSAEAYRAGPGFVQRLRGARCGHPAVICAIAGQPAVIIAADLWNGICEIGNGQPDGVGFPLYTGGADAHYIGPGIGQVRTAAGLWQGGVMCRKADGRWTWIRDLAFDANNAGNADMAIRSESRLDLRLRLAAQILCREAQPRLTAAGRRRLAAELARTETTACVATPNAVRLFGDAGPWRPKTEPFGRNDSWGAAYDCSVSTPDGLVAARATAQFLMPNLMQSRVTSLIDLELNQDVVGRLSHREIADFFTEAWALAFDVLPVALDRPDDDADPGDRPRADLYVINERPRNRGDQRAFAFNELVDLSAFGTTNKTHLDRLAIGVLGRGSLAEADAREVVRKGLVRAAEDAGFDSPDLAAW
jgi:hypothetical protein